MTPRKEPEERLKMGRPTKYKEEYCEEIIAHGHAGGTLLTFSIEKLVAEDTVHEWASVYPDFSESCKIVNALNKQKWIKRAEKISDGSLGSAPMVKFMLSACYGLREKTDVNQTGSLTLIGSAAEIIKQVADGSTTDTANN